MHTTRLISALLIIAPLLLSAGGCGGPPKVKTTFLRGVDLVDMTDQMAQSFARSDTIGPRRSNAEPWVISLYRVVNHTNQVIPENEKWLYLARLRSQLAASDVARQRNLLWVIPPERWAIVAEEHPDRPEPYGLRLNPTHLLTAEFRALTQTSARGRSDAYHCAFELLDIESGIIVWEDHWEVKRALSGQTWD